MQYFDISRYFFFNFLFLSELCKLNYQKNRKGKKTTFIKSFIFSIYFYANFFLIFSIFSAENDFFTILSANQKQLDEGQFTSALLNIFKQIQENIAEANRGK